MPAIETQDLKAHVLCMLQLNLTIRNAVYSCIGRVCLSVTHVPEQQPSNYCHMVNIYLYYYASLQSCLFNLHLQACMSETFAPYQFYNSYLLKQYRNVRILQLNLSSSNVFSSQTQPKVKMVTNICNMQIDLLRKVFSLCNSLHQ